MHVSLFLAAFVSAFPGFTAHVINAAAPKVKLANAVIEGRVSSATPSVAEYLGIPFAQPPLGPLRFLPPQPAVLSGIFNATIRQPSCSQWLTKLPSITDVTPSLVPPKPYSEDCLYLNVFAPKRAVGADKRLPVVVWIHGGVLIWGGTNTPGEFPMRWVDKFRKHIVVQINYRLNVFGYPNARGLRQDEQNAGVKDARMALEWVRNNIRAFGGDASRIILQGQSAGGAMVDILEYGYPHDQIAQGVIHESGQATMLNGTASDPQRQHLAFTRLAIGLGCVSSNSSEELACMRTMDQQEIETYLQEYGDAAKKPVLTFAPIADGKQVFTPTEYRNKYKSKSSLPSLIGFNEREGSTFVNYTTATTNAATNKAIHDLTLWEVQCAVLTAAQQRSAAGAPTHLYFYSGNFSNISPEPWMGSYHFADLPMVFGTHADLQPASTKREYRVSDLMQTLWLAFVSDPTKGLSELGWPSLKPSGGEMLHIAPQGTKRAAVVEKAASVTRECKLTPPKGP